VKDAIAAGVKETGCTLFRPDAGIDTGPILDQRPVPILCGDDVPSLHARIKAREREMLVEFVGREVTLGDKP
jgi:phosphoribosylglycinamide formyltransferase-1